MKTIPNSKFQIPNTRRGVSIIEALFGIFIFTTAFFALYGVLQFSLQTIGQNKARLGAMALAEEQLEYFRSLPFDSVGVVLGNPSGAIPATENITLNGIQYARRNAVFWVDDDADDVAPTDTISTDYKQAKVEVSWNFRGAARSFSAITNITPKGLETNVPGGIFKITAFDSGGALAGASVSIFKTGIINVTRFTNALGQWFEYGIPPGPDYQISVTKPGYGTSRTYGTAEVATPNPGHLTSIDDTVNNISFQIDLLSNMNVYMYSPPAAGSWSDTFIDDSKLASLVSMEVLAGELVLANTLGVYDMSGSATTTWIAPADLYQWKQFTWTDAMPPGTSLRYRVYYDNGGAATLVPDAELPGNAAGFTASPVDLSGLNNGLFGQSNYTRLKAGVVAETGDTAVTPSVEDWTVTYDTHSPRPNFTFNIRGAKTIGTDGVGAPVYKYNLNPATNASGVMATTSIEADIYTISKASYSIAGACPPHPVTLSPNTSQDVHIDMASTNAEEILIHVKTAGGANVPNALVRLYRAAPAFNQTKKAGAYCGQTFWSGIAPGTVGGGDAYSIDASAPPHTSTSTVNNVDVSGYSYIVVTTP